MINFAQTQNGKKVKAILVVDLRHFEQELLEDIRDQFPDIGWSEQRLVLEYVIAQSAWASGVAHDFRITEKLFCFPFLDIRGLQWCNELASYFEADLLELTKPIRQSVSLCTHITCFASGLYFFYTEEGWNG